MFRFIFWILLFIGFSINTYCNPFQSLIPRNGNTSDEEIKENAPENFYSEEPVYTGFLSIEGKYTAFIRYKVSVIQVEPGGIYPFGTVEEITETKVLIKTGDKLKTLNIQNEKQKFKGD